VTTPAAFAADIALAIRALAADPARVARLGQGARDKVRAEGLWPAKAARMVDLYQGIDA
jgi:hypothetical protein